MSKRDIPPFKIRDQVTPTVAKAKALNRKLVVSECDVLTVTSRRFDRQLQEWLFVAKRGACFLAKQFKKVELHFVPTMEQEATRVNLPLCARQSIQIPVGTISLLDR